MKKSTLAIAAVIVILGFGQAFAADSNSGIASLNATSEQIALAMKIADRCEAFAKEQGIRDERVPDVVNFEGKPFIVGTHVMPQKQVFVQYCIANALRQEPSLADTTIFYGPDVVPPPADLPAEAVGPHSLY